MIAKVDPNTLAVTQFKQAHEASRSRRIDVLPDGTIWYGDEARGYARAHQSRHRRSEGMAGARRRRVAARTRSPRTTRAASGSPRPGRRSSWSASTRRPRSSSRTSVSGTIRHMHFDKKTRTMWFGTDANKIGRIALQPAK